MNIALNIPINRLSFGQISTVILRSLFAEEKSGSHNDVFLFPIGQIDLTAHPDLAQDKDFNDWVRAAIVNGVEKYSRDIPVFKLWHFNDGMPSFGKNQVLLTFYELDAPTPAELNVARNHTTYFSSQYSRDVFRAAGVETGILQLAFDSYSFGVKRYPFPKDRIVFNLCGKWEKRKHHAKIIQAWIKRFGGNPKFALQCAVFNTFLGQDQRSVEENNKAVVMNTLQGVKPFNVNFFPMMAENAVYNEFLNSADIIIGMSGGEGFGLPEFQSVAMGKHAVLLNAHSYPTWATKEMAAWVEPSGKIPATDGLFFNANQPYNQGNIFDWSEEAFIAGCEEAIKRVEATNRVNKPGLILQESHSPKAFLNALKKTLQ